MQPIHQTEDRRSKNVLLRARTRLLAAASLAAATGFLLYQLAPDINGKALYEDEAITALISMRPLTEVLDTVLLDRGGAPLHFVLTHFVFSVDASSSALRWLSVLFALAAVPLCFDLGRRLGGLGAGVVAAVVAASSTALAVYGSFGRMYALLVFVAALFADFFVRALEVRTTSAVALAAAAGWLLPAVHPYGAIPALVALVVAAVIWRGRPLSSAVPVVVAVVAALPLLYGDLRLADRASIGAGGEQSLASPGEAWGQLVAAVSAFAGGDGAALVFFTTLALVGLAVLLRRAPAVAALAVSTAIPPLLFTLVRTGSAPDLSPRHLFYGLPLWAAAIGVGVTTLTRRLSAPLGAACLVLVAAIAVVAPASALRDPRDFELGTSPVGEFRSIHAGRHDLLLPYDPVFLAALPDVRRALALPHAPGNEILRTLEHADEPIGAVVIAIPTSPSTVVRLQGPFDEPGALSAAADALTGKPHPASLDWWFDRIERGLCEALRELSRPCP
ncbi:MAG TPA: glycosyltransferase family 39 protein [Gaiellaceae bacterium]|nr:glycosyltransferase family 39 protein [Gaiellaceae bacterium]